jgi:hypothetical protein
MNPHHEIGDRDAGLHVAVGDVEHRLRVRNMITASMRNW